MKKITLIFFVIILSSCQSFIELDDEHYKLTTTYIKNKYSNQFADIKDGQVDLAVNFLRWYDIELNDLSWVNTLRDCPPRLEKSDNWFGLEYKNPDEDVWILGSSSNIFNRFFWTQLIWDFHPNGKYELRSKHCSKDHQCGNQGIYDANGILINKFPDSGTADKVSPSYSLMGHRKSDVIPFNTASKLGLEFVKLYYNVRPNIPTSGKLGSN